MVAFQKGDTEAFRTLHDRHSRPLLNFFFKMSYNHATAQDLTQETWFRILRYADRYKPRATFRTFMYRVARNLWIDLHRSRKAAPKSVSADLRVTEEGATVGDLVESREQPQQKTIEDREAADLIREALTSLPEPQRMVFLLAETQDLKYREIAEILDVPVGTVKSRMNAAVTRLRGLLGHVLG
ncbi:MAG: sigma-70 family RNA polymerase sigma factor [Planctomycetota bacterium]|nr:sigma-70 family RNA polymerase sigma factor [Planctomycetota bacterium]